MHPQTLHFEQFIRVQPATVTHAFTNASMLRYWLCDVATVDPRPGGRLYMAWSIGFYAAGEYTLVEPGVQVGFNWRGRDDPAASPVLVTVAPQETGTHLTLTHTLPDDSPGWENTCREIQRGWQDGLENLASVLETGQDLRFVNRPMLGITFSDFNEMIAKEIGVPVTQGVRLDMTLETMGAYAAGLRGGDVVVQVGDTPIVSFGDFQVALAGKRAGNTLPVTFYRGAEKQTVPMTLSRRPLPEIPATPAGLARQLRARLDSAETQLESVLAGVSDAAASRRTAPGEWTAKEVLAHLLQGERYNHFHIAEVVTGYETWTDGWGGNLDAQVQATVAAFPTVADLLAEIKRLNCETIALYESLPPDFPQNHPAGYWGLVYGALEDPHHLTVHLEQIRNALAAETV